MFECRNPCVHRQSARRTNGSRHIGNETRAGPRGRKEKICLLSNRSMRDRAAMGIFCIAAAKPQFMISAGLSDLRCSLSTIEAVPRREGSPFRIHATAVPVRFGISRRANRGGSNNAGEDRLDGASNPFFIEPCCRMQAPLQKLTCSEHL
jgi:hypothetical protein